MNIHYVESSSVQTCGLCKHVKVDPVEALTLRSRYDHETQHAFVGDYSGQITLLKLEKQTYSTITTLKGHEGKKKKEKKSCVRFGEQKQTQVILVLKYKSSEAAT